MNPEEAVLLRLYVNGDETHGGVRLYEAIVTKARELGLAGASVFAAELGYGAHRVVHDLMNEYSFVGAPVVVETVDSPHRINALLGALSALIAEGLATVSTVSPVRVVRHEHPHE